MERLPNETLLNIAERLPNHDLCVLSQVAKQFTPIAQDVLFRSPTIIPHPQQSDRKDDRFAALLNALVKKPGLAKAVRSLELYPRYQDVPSDDNIFSRLSTNILRLLRVARPNVSEAAIVGTILDVVPNLEHLILDVLAAGYSFTRHAYDRERYPETGYPIEHLFGPHSDPGRPFDRDISHIAGLKKLTVLELRGGDLEWAWCQLPSLKKLRLGRGCRLQDRDVPSTASSSTETIELDVCTMDFERDNQLGRVRHLLKRFTSLKNLTLQISDHVHVNISHISTEDTTPAPKVTTKSATTKYTWSSYLREFSEDPDFNVFIERQLAPVAASLEHLTILESDEAHNTFGVLEGYAYDSNLPPATFTQFKKLRSLKVPQPLITGGLDDLDADCALSILPKTLENLEITHVDSEYSGVWDLLESVHHRRSAFPAVKAVHLSNYDHYYAGSLMRRMRDLGIEFTADEEDGE